MATLKLLLYKSNKNKLGQFSLALRITKNGTPKYIHIEWLDQKYWNAKKSEVRRSHPYAEDINSRAKQKYALAQQLITQFKVEHPDFDLKVLVDRIKNNRIEISFFDISKEELDRILFKKEYNTYKDCFYKNKLFLSFVNSDVIAFKEITHKFIKDFIAYLESKNYKKNVIISNLSFIRKIYNIAIKQKIVSADHYPFGSRHQYKIRGKSSSKIGLVEEELVRFSEVSLPFMSNIWLAQKSFLFSFYLAGMRISDVIKMQWDQIHDGRLHYEMGKNEKQDSLKIPQEALEILTHFKSLKTHHNDYIFPFLKGISPKDKIALNKKIDLTKSLMNYYLRKIGKLAGIDKKLSNHISRHSFGTIAGNKIPMRSLQKLYRHSDISVTMNYQQYFDHSITDKALQDVLNFSDKS